MITTSNASISSCRGPHWTSKISRTTLIFRSACAPRLSRLSHLLEARSFGDLNRWARNQRTHAWTSFSVHGPRSHLHTSLTSPDWSHGIVYNVRLTCSLTQGESPRKLAGKEPSGRRIGQEFLSGLESSIATRHDVLPTKKLGFTHPPSHILRKG